MIPALAPGAVTRANWAVLRPTDFWNVSAPLGSWPVYVEHEGDGRVCEADRSNNIVLTGLMMTIIP